MKPILVNTEMVKAILEGRKTVTRRIADINTEITCNDGSTNHHFIPDDFAGGTRTGFVCRKCGFGVAPPHSRVPCGTSIFRPRYWPGDILYARETWAFDTGDTDGEIGTGYFAYRADDLHHPDCKWRPSIHMPKDAARIFLRVKGVSIERLQDITAEECPMEGVPLFSGLVSDREKHYKTAFAKLWDSTIKPADLSTCGWDANPWVWVIKFERCEKPEM